MLIRLWADEHFLYKKDRYKPITNTMKKLIPLFVVMVLCGCSCGAAESGVANFDNVIPQPKMVSALADVEGYTLSEQSVVAYGEGVAMRDAEFLVEYVAQSTGIRLAAPVAGEQGGVRLTIDNSITDAEGYRLQVGPEGVVIAGGSADGLFYGVQTLRKSLPVGKFESVVLPATVVEDYPQFEYRGMHLDVSRHFDGVEFVKKYIDMLALHNMNTFHWHLTDDQGWRIEIKKYPKLTSVATTRSQTVIGRNSGEWDGVPYGEGCFYTQEQIREVVAYAAERHIDIIPEIDMPGHMVAALAAYPELGCTGGPYEVWTIWGVSEDLLCVGNDATVQFAKDVLEEVVALFPYEYVHIGGDECPKVRWHECPKCQARIDALGLRQTKAKSPEEALQGWFMREMADFLAERGKTVIGWDEILDGENLADNMMVMSWRGEAGGIKAAQKKVRSIMTPNSYLYFDYYQTREVQREPFAIGGYNPLDRVYGYNPVAGVPEEYREYIIGVQANVWREYIKTADHVEHMVLPRAAALCEVQWAKPEQKDYEAFLGRLQPMLKLYQRLDYTYAPYVLDVEVQVAPAAEGRAFEVSLSTLDNAEVRYTTNGRKPNRRSTLYEGPVRVDESVNLRAVAVREGKCGDEVSLPVSFSKSTLCDVTLTDMPAPHYTYEGAKVLADGLVGNKNYRTGRWLGFHGKDCVATIDLGSEQTIGELLFNVCVNKDDGCLDARGVKVEVSADGVEYVVAHSEDWPAMTEAQDHGVYNHKVKFAPAEGRWVRITIVCEKSIPSWHSYAAGGEGFLFVDEIAVE